VNTDVNSVNSVNLPISITSLAIGSHSLQVRRSNQYGNNTTLGSSTTFNLRSGYDLKITISANGSISQSETKMKRVPGSVYNTPMTDQNFNMLVNNIQNLRTTNARLTAINNAFNNTANYFTTAQARQLIGMINSQSSRLSLAKSSYKTITDPANFSEVNALIVSQAHRRELAAYVNNYNLENGINNGNTGVAMSAASFNAIYRDAQAQWPASAKYTYISNAFANTSYYFTTAQAEQLIGVVYPESERLALAKASYDNLVDPANFSSLYDLFNSQTSRNDLAYWVSTNSNTGGVRTPMSSTSFNSLYSAAQQQYSTTSRLNYINNAFSSTTNYFTTIQAETLIRLITTESDRLALAKNAWNNLTDQANYTQLYDLFTNSYYRNEFASYASSNGGYSGNIGTVREPMPDQNFRDMVRRISNRYGLGAKMSGLTEEFNKTENTFTTLQARELIMLVSDEANRLSLGKLVYDNVVDPQNFPQLYDVLATQTSRDELDAYVRANYAATGYSSVRVPMTGEAFTAVYKNISNTWGLGAKYASLTDLFANTSNNFTTQQTRQLILLVSSESNRLQLAKSSFDNVVDPENFSQLYDIFSSQASVNELAAYVNSYSYNR
jgi:hypothetical protein